MVTSTDLLGCDPFTSYQSGATSNEFRLPAREFSNSIDCFDEVMRAIPEGATIRLSEGTFRTRGSWSIYGRNDSFGFMVKSGWKIIGAGKDKTTIRLSHAPSDGINYLFGSPRAWIRNPASKTAFFMRPDIALFAVNKDLLVNNVEIRGMTLDCAGASVQRTTPVNAAQSNDLILGAVYLFGDNIKLEDLHVINAISLKKSQGRPAENFIINLKGYRFPLPARDESGFPVNMESLAHVQVKNVKIDDYLGGYCSAILITGETRGIVEDSHITLRQPEAQSLGNGGPQFGLNCGGRGTFGVIFRNNIVENSARGVNNDTGPNANLTIEGNQFLNCNVGIYLNALNGGRTFEALTNRNGIVYSTVKDNTITLAPRSDAGSTRAGIAVIPRIPILPEHAHYWSGAYAVKLINNSIYNEENTSGAENWGIQMGVFPAAKHGGEYWSFQNSLEGNKFYDDRQGNPLFNITAHSPTQKDWNDSPIINNISTSSSNLRYTRKGFFRKLWKPNGAPLGSKEITRSSHLLEKVE